MALWTTSDSKTKNDRDEFCAQRLLHHHPALFGTAADTANQMPANQFSPCLLQNVSRKSFVTSIALIHLAFL